MKGQGQGHRNNISYTKHTHRMKQQRY